MIDIALQTSKRLYTNLADYAAQQGAPESAFVAAGYVETTRRGRKALKYPTETGPRWRFLDGLEPRHDSPKGYETCWYGLKRAFHMAGERRTLIMVNGAAGVVVAQHFNALAFAVSDGESRKLSDKLLEQLKPYKDYEIIVALDCDSTGQDRAAKRARQLLDAGFIVRAVDLQLGDNGDFADFCKIHGAGAFEKLLTLPEISPAPPKKQYQTRQAGEALLSTDERARRIATDRLDKYLSNLSRASSGRRDLLLNVGIKIGGLVKGGYITYTEAESGLMNAAASCGLIEKLGEKEVERHIRGSFENATATVITLLVDNPKSGKNPPKPPKIPRETITLEAPAQIIPFTADRTFSSRYVNQAPDGVLKADCIALKTATGGGKTTWAAENTADAPSILTIAFRRSLVHAQADKYGAMAYDTLDGRDSLLISAADSISTTVDSLYKFDGRDFHTIVIDEYVSLLNHFSSAGTLKEKGAAAWEMLKRLITRATRVIVMDANLNDYALAELKALRGDLVCIENTYTEPKAPTQLLPNRLAFHAKALERIGVADKPILLGVTSPAEARVTKDLITARYPSKQVRVVTVKQSHLIDTQSFIRSINMRLHEVDVLIFNGAMNTGVSVDVEVDSIICLIDRPLAPADGVQMLGRARKTALRFAHVPDGIEGLNSDAADLYQDLELATTLTGVEASSRARALARLHARYEAHRNAEISNYMPIFRAYCHADGSNTQPVFVRFDKFLSDQLKAIRQAHTTQRRADVLDVERVQTITSEMLDMIREVGLQEITPEIDAGYLRHKIESATGQPINEALYDKYHTRQARSALYRVDISDGDNTSEIDQRENIDDLPLHQRTHARAIKSLLGEGLKRLGVNNFDELPNVINSVTAEAFANFGEWAAQRTDHFKALLGYRTTHNGDLENNIKAVRFFLAAFGITLERKQVMRAGQRFMTYSVDSQAIAELKAILTARRAKAVEAREHSITTKRQYKPLLPIRSNSSTAQTTPRQQQGITVKVHYSNPFSTPTSIQQGISG